MSENNMPLTKNAHRVIKRYWKVLIDAHVYKCKKKCIESWILYKTFWLLFSYREEHLTFSGRTNDAEECQRLYYNSWVV